MHLSIYVFICVLFYFKISVCVTPILLQNGQVFSSLLYSGDTILFAYNITDPCSDITIFLTGDGDAYISPVETYPNVYSYSIYSFTCNGDAIHIDHDDAYFQTGLCAYLDPLVYDSYTNMSIQVTEASAQNTVSSSSSVSIIGNTFNFINASDSIRICIRDASKGVTFTNNNNNNNSSNSGDDDDGSSFTILLTKLNPSFPYFDAHTGNTHFHSSTSGTAIQNWMDFYSQQSQQNFQFTIKSSFTTHSLPFSGNYWMTIQPSCLFQENSLCFPLSVNFSISATSNDSSNSIVQSYYQLSSGFSVSHTFTPITNINYYSIAVGVCDSLSVKVTAEKEVQVFISTSKIILPSVESIYSWKLNIADGDSQNITISYKDPSFVAGSFFIAVVNTLNVTNSFSIVANTTLGTDALVSNINDLFSYSNFVASNEIKWYSVCITDKERGLNITTTWHNLTGGYGFETVDIIASRIPFLDANYTHYIQSATPSKNYWANWAYSFNPFPGCRDSFLLTKNNTSIYYPGVIYIGMYSFCLPSCNYCHGDIWFSFSIQFADNDLTRCLQSGSTTGNIINPEQSSVNGAFYLPVPFYSTLFFTIIVIIFM